MRSLDFGFALRSQNGQLRRFLWAGDEPKPVLDFRHPQDKAEARPVDEIPLAELRGLVQSNPELLTDEDPVTAIARMAGVSRVTKSIRARITEAIAEGKDAL